MGDSFFIIDDNASSGFQTEELPGFSLNAPARSGEIMEFLNSSIRINVVKYLKLADRIRKELRGDLSKSLPDPEPQSPKLPREQQCAQEGDAWVYRKSGREIRIKLSPTQYQDYCWDEIDNFLKHPPPRKRATELENIVEDQAVGASILPDQEIVSETLAQLHLSQGKKNKAIEIYNKLILLFPEKKAYFADQIQKIITEK